MDKDYLFDLKNKIKIWAYEVEIPRWSYIPPLGYLGSGNDIILEYDDERKAAWFELAHHEIYKKITKYMPESIKETLDDNALGILENAMADSIEEAWEEIKAQL